MNQKSRNAIFLIAISACCTWAGAQNVYRCGQTYSELPCPGGTAVPVADERAPAQRAQSENAARRDARLADAMEKKRLKAEAEAAARQVAVPPKPGASATRASSSSGPKKPAVFKATAPPAPGTEKTKTKKPAQKTQKA